MSREKDTPTLIDRVPGWRTYEYTLVEDDTGELILVADEIVRSWFGYVARCRAIAVAPVSLPEWMRDAWMGEGVERSAASES